jgi:signal transduction histidine kinase
VATFSLIRYFAVASTLVIATVAGVTGWAFSRNLQEHLTEEAAQYAKEMAHSLNRAIYTEFIAPQRERGETVRLGDPTQLRAIDAIVRQRMDGLRIQTLNWFDPAGTVLYSTKPEYIGRRSLENPGIATALRGETLTLFKSAEMERDSLAPDHDLLETYSPFYELAEGSATPGALIGVLELYQDGRPVTRRIHEGRRQTLIATGALMAVLFLALFAIVRRGDLRIRELTDALGDSNRRLEERVRARTLESERSRRRLELLFDGIADGISVIGPGHAVSQVNSGIAQLFGVQGEQPCYARYAGRTEPCQSCPAERALASGERAEQRYLWPTQFGEREVEVTAFPFAREDGAAAVIEVVRDVSERAELERQVMQAQSLASLGSMAAGVAHEIRNPIGIITSSAQLLGHTEALPERDRELLRVLRDESARVDRTISEFVSFATPSKPHRSATQPGALLERVQSALRPQAEQRGIELELALPAGLPAILVDGELLYRALVNLVLNALQAQGHGGRVRLQAARGTERIVQLRICDEGPGIAAADLERVFEPFFSKRSGGTGLGLSIVQRIVTANGGRISVASGATGTTFTLCFPEAPQ